MAASSTLHLGQIAFSVTDLVRTHGFYRDVFGFLPAGGTSEFRGPLASAVQGLPDAASVCWWMVDQRDFMQLEMFEFESPPVRPLPADWRPCDVGYSAIGLHVRDLDGALQRAGSAGSPPVGPVLGARGARRVCLRDPEGVLVELFEADPVAARGGARPQVPVVARSLTVSVPDLARACRFWVDTLGLREASGVALHEPAHEALWGLAGAKRETRLLEADDFLLELVRYDDPRGRPWPAGYRISDQGILNVAFTFRDRDAFWSTYRRVVDAGYRSNREPIDLGTAGVVYCNDDQGFSVELLFAAPEIDASFGFAPAPPGADGPPPRSAGARAG